MESLRFGGAHDRYYSNIFDSLVTANAFGASNCWDHLYFLTQCAVFLLPISVVFNYFMNLVSRAANSEPIY